MQINASGGKSGQVTEDYMLSGTCILFFFFCFSSCALSLRAFVCVCVCVRARLCVRVRDICSNIRARIRFYIYVVE